MKNIKTISSQANSPSEFLSQYFKYLKDVLSNIDVKQVDKLVLSLEKARKNGNTIFIIGNGGSATTASSMANDLGFDIIKKTKTKKPFKFLSLTDNNSVITAIANDVGYEEVFVNQLKIHYRKGDQLIIISASGNSPNLVSAAKWFKSQKGKVISFLGFDGGKLKKISDIILHAKTEKGDYGPVAVSYTHLRAHETV